MKPLRGEKILRRKWVTLEWPVKKATVLSVYVDGVEDTSYELLVPVRIKTFWSLRGKIHGTTYKT